MSSGPSTSEITRLLLAWSDGDGGALEHLTPLIYGELRSIAQNAFRGERRDHTLQSTALVHETFLRLVDQRRVQWRNRAHFFAIAARLMRRLLVDHARSHRASKRGGGQLLTLAEDPAVAPAADVDLIALDDALRRLSELDPRQARLVELRFFGGLTVPESAEVLGLSPATVKREWSMAKAWLFGRLATAPNETTGEGDGDGPGPLGGG
ncbi:MAG: sigma-70 family RNA polymerase sigma factor [Acidobacteriota bacterium]